MEKATISSKIYDLGIYIYIYIERERDTHTHPHTHQQPINSQSIVGKKKLLVEFFFCHGLLSM